MPFHVPESFAVACEALVAARVSARQADAHSAEVAKAEREAAKQLWLELAPHRLKDAEAIFRWFAEADDNGVLKMLGAAVDAADLSVWGPMLEDGSDSNGRTGSYSVGIVVRGEPGLVVRHRLHPSYGTTQSLRTPREVADAVPTAVLARIGHDIGSHEVWLRVEGALARRAQRVSGRARAADRVLATANGSAVGDGG